MRLAMLFTVLTPENKMIFESATKRGITLERVFDSELMMELTASKKEYDGVLQRSSSYARTLYSSFYLEQMGTFVCNPYKAHKLCGDKFLASVLLGKAGVPTPKTFGAFTPDAAKAAAKKLGFPVVMKPVFGSWARLVHKLNDDEALDAELESREEMGHAFQKVYYLQEHINKPGRDMRVFVIGDECVGAIYRTSTEKSGWITNTGRGGTASNCPVTSEIRELALKAANVFGEGIYGVDMMETGDGRLVVHEVNHTTEFRNSVEPTGADIPGKMVEYFVKRSKK
ncbi:lysine biosynthesis protein LysX [Candidatus Micrarchaeota archaeon]|nr:lysine biosynthesis protein LysX [Candidatus Micrarchaeota archaeon]